METGKTIGIFDSGCGGLSVLSEALHSVSGASYLYYADTDHVPYGSRTNSEILSFSDAAVSCLIEAGADAVIMACNTASAVSCKVLREKYDLPIIAMEPAVRPALHEADAGRILVMATPVTLREEKLKNLIAREHAADRIDLLPMPDLVTFAETEQFDGREVSDYITGQLSEYDLSQYTAIVLGCTHFNYFKPLLHQLLKETFHADLHLIEGNAGTVRRAADLLGLPYDVKAKEEPAHTRIRYFRSGAELTAEEMARMARLLVRLEISRDE